MFVETAGQVNKKWLAGIYKYKGERGNVLYKYIAGLIVKYGRSIIDVGCGDANLLKFLPEEIHYLGIDIGDKVIENNIINKYNVPIRPNITFLICDMWKPNIYLKPDIAYFGGIMMNLTNEDKLKLVRLYDCKHYIIEELSTTDLSWIKKHYKVISEYTLKVNFIDKDENIGKKEIINSRKIILFKKWI